MLNRKIKNFKCEKFALELKNNVSEGVAWLSSNDQYTVSQIIKMHYTVSYYLSNFQIYAGYKLRTYLIGYPYNSNELEDDDDQDEDVKFQKKMMKLSLIELKQKFILNKYLRRTLTSEAGPDEKLEQQQPELKQVTSQVEDDEEMEVTTF